MNKDIRFVIFIFLYILFPNFINAQMEISGFFDVLNIREFTKNNYNQFQINQFEIDISYAYQNHLSLGTAIAYNNETQNMELAMAYIHYNFINKKAMHPRREETMDHSGIVIGKFDINFGLDYLSYPSPDRPIISQPLIFEKTIGNWNDIGVNYHIVKGNLNFHIWAVNGFNNGINLGGNLRYSFLPFLNLGFSRFSDFEKLSKIKAWANGLDILIKTEVIQLKSEYLWAKGIYEGNRDTLTTQRKHKGFYVQILTQLKEIINMPIFITLQYGQWNSKFDRKYNSNYDNEERFTVGIGYQFNKNISARMELLTETIETKETHQKGTLQVVVAF